MGNLWLQDSPDTALFYFLEAARLAQHQELIRKSRELYCRYDGEAMRGIGNANYYLGNYEVAEGFYQRALRCMEEIQDEQGMLKCHNNLGLVLWKMGNYSAALEHYLNAKDLAEETSNTACLGPILNNIGLLYWNHENFDEAMAYYKKSLSLNTQMNNASGIADAYNNLGLVSWKKGTFDSAIVYYQKSLEIKKGLGDLPGISSCYTNIGLVYNDQERYNKALEYYLKALTAIKQIDDRHEIALIHGNIASTYFSLAGHSRNQSSREEYLAKSVRYGERSLSEAQAIGAVPLVNSAAWTLEKAWKELGDYRKSTNFAELYIETRDSLFHVEKSHVLAEMESRYAAEKKQLEIDRLLKERSFQTEILSHSRTQNRIQGTLLILTLLGILLITIYTVWVVRLNTRIRKSNAVLEGHKAEIEEKNLAKDKLFSVISHDLRNPFNVILGYSEYLVAETAKLKGHPELHELSVTLENASRQVNNLLTNLLEWSLLQTNRMIPKTEPVSIGSLAEEILSLFESAASEQQVSLETEIQEGLTCSCDSEMIKSVLRNLVSNALKFTGSGGSVAIRARAETDRAVISVADTGIGLLPEEAEGLFTLKCRIPRESSNHSGAGLGLIISSEFVELNHGRLTVDSTPGRGTVFSFTLPLSLHPPKETSQPRKQGGPRNPKVLVADDNESNMFLLNRILSRVPYDVVSARNGQEVLECIQAHQDIRLVLMDLRMPVMDGLEACREIRKSNPDLPVIAQTGNNQMEDVRELREAGFTDWLFKPIDKEALLAMTGRYISSTQS